MAQIISLEDYKNKKTLQAAVGEGRNLALNPEQTAKLQSNAKEKVVNFQSQIQVVAETPAVPVQEPIIEEAPVMAEPAVMTSTEQEEIIPPVTEDVMTAPVVEDTPLEASPVISESVMEPVIPLATDPVIPMSIEENVISEPIMDEVPVFPSEPVVMDLPIIEENVVVTPETEEISVAPVSQVEIVPTSQETSEYDALIITIETINQEYNQKIMDLNTERANKIKEAIENSKKKIMDEQAQIIDLKNRAEEHLKNAQAAEQIANIAHQNAQNIQSTDFIA